MALDFLSKIKKKLFKKKNAYKVEKLEEDVRLFHASRSGEIIKSDERSHRSFDDDVFADEPDVSKGLRSKDTLSKRAKKAENYNRFHNSEYDRSIERKENVRRCKSETSMSCQQNEIIKSRSIFKSSNCITPETATMNSYLDMKISDESKLKHEPCSTRMSSFQHLQDDRFKILNRENDRRTDEGIADEILGNAMDFSEEIVYSFQSCLSNGTVDAVVKTSDKMDWEYKGARPKTPANRNSSSSGIYSIEDRVSKPSGFSMLDKFAESTLQDTTKRLCVSSPAGIFDFEDDVVTTKTVNQQTKRVSCTNISASNIQLNFLDGNSASISNPSSPPIMSVQVMATDKLDALIAKTDVVMETFASEEKKTKRIAFEAGLQELTDENRSRVVIIVGHKGDGKTVCGRYILQNLEGFKYKFLISSIKEWHVVRIRAEQQADTAIFVDDIFGTDRFQKAIYDKWHPVLDEIYAACTKGNVVGIIGINKKVYETYLSEEFHHSLFSKGYIIDLTEKYALKPEEKINILTDHLMSFKMAKEVKICEDRSEDNTAVFTENEVLSIFQGTIEEILLVKIPVGFPRAAAAFASDIRNIKQGVEYFDRPQKFMVAEIDKIRKSEDQTKRQMAFAMGILVSFQGTLQLSDFETEEKHLSSKKRFLNKHKKSKGSLTLKDKLKRRIPVNADKTSYLREGINELKGNYVSEEDGKIEFCNVSIFYSVAISFGKEFGRDIVVNMPFDFVAKYVGPSEAFIENLTVYITLDSNSYVVLFDRFLYEIEKRQNIRLVMEHHYMGENPFVSSFLEYIISKGKMKRFLELLDIDTKLNVLCLGMAKMYKKNTDFANCTEEILITGLWDRYMKKSSRKEYFEKEAVKIAALRGHESSFEALVKRINTVDAKCFDAVIQSGSSYIVDVFLKYRVYQFDLKEALKAVYKYHYHKECEKATQFAKHLASKQKDMIVEAVRALKMPLEALESDFLKYLESIES